MNYPEAFLARMKDLLNDEFEIFIKSLEEERLYGVRANTLKVSTEALPSLLTQNLSKVPWCNEGYYVSNEEPRPSKSVFYEAGLFYIQEPSAMAPGSVIDISEGDFVLDLCAAPGGKSTQMAARLKGTGLLVANDVSATRCRALVKNLESFGVTNAVVTSEQPSRLARSFPNFFDKILIDAPCSGEGMFRKDSDALKRWGETKNVHQTQREVLYWADQILKDGGTLLYSTCTFSPSENEAVIASFLDANKNYTLLEINHEALGFSKGLEKWAEGGQAWAHAQTGRCARIWPHRQKGEGHFLALLKKDGDRRENKLSSLPKIKNKDFNDFCNQYLNIKFESDLQVHGAHVYMSRLKLSGLRVLRSGLFLGTLKKDRFEPSHALAMALKPCDVKQVINFSKDSTEVKKYLAGESFEMAGQEGYNLVCVEGYPLGWGKLVKGTLKNKRL